MSKKEFLTRVDCKDKEMGDLVNGGWVIHFMQFMPDGKLNVVFCREVTVPAAAPAVGTTVLTILILSGSLVFLILFLQKYTVYFLVYTHDSIRV